jgi:hypothetical protein
MILHPQNNFTVVRQIQNHLDTDTNYVRAVIRNAYTDEIIETLDLDDKGEQRFSKNWHVIADGSGQGFYISIVTSVYTDAGYTSKNPNYGDEENTYLVQDRLTNRGGGGGEIDLYILRKIIREEVAKIPAPEPVKMPKMRFGEVLTAIDSAVERLTVEPAELPEKVDLAPVLNGIKKLETAVLTKEVTPPTDLSPILQKLSEDSEKDELTAQQLQAALSSVVTEIISKIEALPPLFEETIKGIELSIAPSTAVASSKPKEKAKEGVPFDISQFAS